ncbi:type I-E CRISPR-associated protein Cas6/Cse3/CasE [Trinickia caryophylli]|uniref:CRISPR system Cascade subunit CasE n=1 Tax=Trinickia caryophylli TaxID=28094 RepID=A0A1X7FS80_TRICW|nr:type I-E CRISPR-associated protein Cas6/Cse3/CasE [Trinickia caryophylli]PMS11965.1 type I-E CRISPR-associated protein Cas6/Cse3/CasE [Trinickia caryophylli]TRX13955.1 type I-E CRISPR-associated protein Cas6/Cse3/CasE [Trinickia caryophylli]WQE15553.1 type I-E CRISPR-associated protein Cas6/Cse3/CasE [Trinickia caryophylli]SMF57793.1 CRISPR system Cascade subunit CasE [Trinickia caryophylli]GLU33696.1 type I-E CRISPR-associated protein Cas6/Cse3/CasE [Trinickia caryophylli]
MTHYLSRITVPSAVLQDESTLMSTGDVYRDHALMWKLFPGAPDAKRDFLFRAETGANGHLLYYLMSRRQPRAWHSSVKVESKLYQPRLEVGEWVHFSLRANPVVAKAIGKEQRGRRHDVLMAAKTEAKAKGLSNSGIQTEMTRAALGWLTRRAEAWGLEVDADEVQVDAYLQHALHSKGRWLRFSSVDYQGMARVSDSDKLIPAMLGQPASGPHASLGHALGFGCGLLLVKRLP